MKKKIVTGVLVIASFAGGLALGNYICNKKRDAEGDAEIEDIKKMYHEKLSRLDSAMNKKPIATATAEPETAGGWTNYSSYFIPGEPEDETDAEPGTTTKIFVIPPREYGEFSDYEMVELKYFEDGVVADFDGKQLSEQEVKDTLGEDLDAHFGEYEDDTVYIRNIDTQTDYCIIYQEESYIDMLERKPYIDEGND